MDLKGWPRLMKLERCTTAKLKRLFDLTSQSRRRFALVANKAKPLFSKNSTFSDATPSAKTTATAGSGRDASVGPSLHIVILCSITLETVQGRTSPVDSRFRSCIRLSASLPVGDKQSSCPKMCHGLEAPAFQPVLLCQAWQVAC